MDNGKLYCSPQRRRDRCMAMVAARAARAGLLASSRSRLASRCSNAERSQLHAESLIADSRDKPMSPAQIRFGCRTGVPRCNRLVRAVAARQQQYCRWRRGCRPLCQKRFESFADPSAKLESFAPGRTLQRKGKTAAPRIHDASPSPVFVRLAPGG